MCARRMGNRGRQLLSSDDELEIERWAALSKAHRVGMRQDGVRNEEGECEEEVLSWFDRTHGFIQYWGCR